MVSGGRVDLRFVAIARACRERRCHCHLRHRHHSHAKMRTEHAPEHAPKTSRNTLEAHAPTPRTHVRILLSVAATLSLDGKAVINHVPAAEKYKILL